MSDPRSMVGASLTGPQRAKAVLEEALARRPAEPPLLARTGAGYASAVCAHPFPVEVDGVVVCPRCETALGVVEPVAESDGES